MTRPSPGHPAARAGTAEHLAVAAHAPGAADLVVAAHVVAAVLAGMALLLRLALTGWILTRLHVWSRARLPVAGVNGTWYLWAVGTQSLPIAAAISAFAAARIAPLAATAARRPTR